jgi:hypothetical protein
MSIFRSNAEKTFLRKNNKNYKKLSFPPGARLVLHTESKVGAHRTPPLPVLNPKPCAARRAGSSPPPPRHRRNDCNSST